MTQPGDMQAEELAELIWRDTNKGTRAHLWPDHCDCPEIYRENAAAVLAAGYQRVPAGWVVVPEEPTEVMIQDGISSIPSGDCGPMALKVAWEAMLRTLSTGNRS